MILNGSIYKDTKTTTQYSNTVKLFPSYAALLLFNCVQTKVQGSWTDIFDHMTLKGITCPFEMHSLRRTAKALAGAVPLLFSLLNSIVAFCE